MNAPWIIPALPLLGFVVLGLAGRRMPRWLVSVTGIGSVGIAALVSLMLLVSYLSGPQQATSVALWTWIHVGIFSPAISFTLDPLSLLMTVVVTFISFLIHLYSSEYMAEDPDYSRFFAYMNLFVASMTILVLAQNLLLLYLGWEGVGLCSYLLIGFWYKDRTNALAAMKAFIVTRVGDTALAVGLFILFLTFGTLDIPAISAMAGNEWQIGSGAATAVALLLLGGAVGKSAQLPLQTWLPDAMAGPTPVSALIHSSTMVTAGVYLIARMHAVFDLAPAAQTAVAVIGAATLLLAGGSALVQWDIKRVLAYSTISQIGYMFLALGVGAYSAAMFHFLTHAFFKALLFLGAGVLLHCLHEERDMFRMGGLRRALPSTFWTFLIGSASLAALPLVTAGFYSKDLILWEAFASPSGSFSLWAAAIVGALLTALYSFRMVFVTFFGEEKLHPHHAPGLAMVMPLIILAILSIVGGFIETPGDLGHVRLFSAFLGPLFGGGVQNDGLGLEVVFQLLSVVVTLGGIGLAYLVYYRRPAFVRALDASPLAGSVKRFWFGGWGFDTLYDRLFVGPYVSLARAGSHDVVDLYTRAIAGTATFFFLMFRLMQGGRVRFYAAGIAAGAIIIIGIVLLL